ncbi:MAG TPA: hypothetical protein VK968_15975, partial [Roseimicrobium sp.]|nr:hypothetical protein [Roseimicrobium sp.]
MKRALTFFTILFTTGSILFAAPKVDVLRLPNNGIQPSAAVDAGGVLHVVFLAGEAKASDVFYVRRDGKDGKWSSPLRVNDRPGSAVAVGTVRGPQMALGKGEAIHVVWNGSSAAGISATGGAPLLVSRKLPRSDAFDPQRNIMTTTTSLDGGADIAADGMGKVFVAWHGNFVQGTKGEETRGVFLSTSEDDGAVFSPERVIDSNGNGACGCCGLSLAADGKGNVGVIYRTARQKEQRNIQMLSSTDGGKTFQERLIDTWRGNTCPMSTMNLIAPATGGEWIATWEHAGQVHWA